MLHRIVIVGGGAGGLGLATRLGRNLGKRNKAEVTLVDANLTHIWKPLLHEVAAGSMNAADNEINYVAHAKWNHFNFQIGRMSGLDRASKTVRISAAVDEQGVQLAPDRTLDYDTLVIAIGSLTNDFNTPGAAEHCIFLDAPQQAAKFHRQLLAHYLTAHANRDTSAQLRVAIVGAGATGVELAAELHYAAQELAGYGLDSIQPKHLEITVLDAGKRVLPALPEALGKGVHKALNRLGINVITEAPVTEVTAGGLKTANGNYLPADLKVWAAGIKASSVLKDLDGLKSNRINQLIVRPTLQTTLDDNIFAMGDCASCPLNDDASQTVPPRAQAAHQQAALLAKSLKLHLERKSLPKYRYQDYGSLVSLSRTGAKGYLMGNLMGRVNVGGWMARVFYVSLYRMHQATLMGKFKTGCLMLAGRIRRRTSPRLKLH